MYIGVDIGGTKTLVCVLTNEGVIKESVKFPTPKDYAEWKTQLRATVESLKTRDFRAGSVAVPGEVDRKHGRIVVLGNLGWKDIPVLHDVERITGCPMRVENDAKLGGLSEAMLLKRKYSRVLYVTISTGIGIGLIVDQKIDAQIGDGGGRSMLLMRDGKLVPWESFGSGKAIVETYGKMASEINDKATWKKIVRNITPGFIELIAILEPEAIVIGGGAGHYLDKFHDFLVADLKKYETPMLTIPPILGAQRPDEAVAYGCYDYAKQLYA
ncbi:MAG TPA: ROK family protein [Candidatus Saccharibacteria bacterium]|jgi:glucokinase|nr:ROK family protein [Candidatus Saccharibacteria bacterium]